MIRSDAEKSAHIDRMVARRIKPAPGLAIAVIRDGRVVHLAGYGCADLETATPITPQTQFHMASTAKQFTALGIMMLKEKGLLGKLAIFGNDGEKDALESIEKGELTGTQYTDVYQQGRFAAAAATVLGSGMVNATAVKKQARLLMPYVIATRDNVRQIQPHQRW